MTPDEDDWLIPTIAGRHQVLLIDVRQGGRASLLPEDSLDPWPSAGLQFLERMQTNNNEIIRRQEQLDKFDIGIVPRLLRLALREPSVCPRILKILVGLVDEVPEIAAEVSRCHLGVLRYIKHNAEAPGSVATHVAAVEYACQRNRSLAGDGAWHNEMPPESPHWLAFGSRHYVLRFAAASPDVPLGGAPPPALLRVGAFGRPSEGSVVDATSTKKLRTGGRLWCAGVLLARVMLGEFRDVLSGHVVLELGCGLGVVGITLANCTLAARCILTDVEPCIVEAARANIRHAELHNQARVEVLDMRDRKALRQFSSDNGVSVVVGSDLIYGILTVEDVAAAVVAALPCGGRAYLLMPTLYRSGMSHKGFYSALEHAGLVVVSARVVDDGGAHFAFSACEDDQQYVLYETVAARGDLGVSDAGAGTSVNIQ